MNKLNLKRVIQVNNKFEASLIESYADLQEELADLTSRVTELQKIKSQYENHGVIKQLLEETFETNNLLYDIGKKIIRILRKGYDKKSPRYKEAYDFLYSKVNKQLKNAADEYLDTNTTLSKVFPILLKTNKDTVDESISVKTLWNKFHRWMFNKSENLGRINDKLELLSRQLDKQLKELENAE